LPKEGFYDLDFYKYFTSKGYRVKCAKVVVNQRLGKPLGYGYLQFANKQEADRCLNEMNNTMLNGLPLRIVHSVPKVEYNEKANLLVKNIDREVTQQEVYELFIKFGNILSCKLETYADGKSRGYAYIQYESEEDADKAIE
jgi:polyadenylate-binding protein